MKKRLTLVAAICFAVALCFALVGCGGSNRAAFVGTWNLESGTDENLDAESISLMKSLGLEVDLTLADDGTGSLEMFGSSSAVSWEAKSATEASITIDGAEASLTLADDKLTLQDSAGASMTFAKKADEAASSAAAADASASSAAATDASASSAAADTSSATSAGTEADAANASGESADEANASDEQADASESSAA